MRRLFFPCRMALLLAAASTVCLLGTSVQAQTDTYQPADSGEVDVRRLFGVDASGEPVNQQAAPETPETAPVPAPAPVDTTDIQPLQQAQPLADDTIITDPDSLDATQDLNAPTALTPDTTVIPAVEAVDPVVPGTNTTDPKTIVTPENSAAESTAPTTAEIPATDPAPTPESDLEPEEPEPVKSWENKPIVKLRALDKVTARTMTFEANVGAVARFGDLFIKVQACREPPAIFTPESAAFLQVWQVPAGQKQSVWVFSGWMFATSPALSAMDHPIYDVWILDCIDPNAPKPPKADAVSKEAAPAAATKNAPAETEEVAPAD